jgi:hypothetical protein
MLPRSKRARAMVLGAGVLVASAMLVLSQARARTALRLVRGFSPLQDDARVFHEAGAEDLARAIAEALPWAVARVEERQSAPFKAPFRVYVCASHESFTRHIGQSVSSPVRGIAFPWDVWVSPKAFSFHGEDTHRGTLAHELSHLHLGQRLGWWKRIGGVPSWFQEGLADWVAGTGDEQVSRREAREAILGGRSLVPDGSGHLPIPKRPQDYGLTWPMFHMQSRMFVEYLRSRDATAFAAFVAAVVRGTRFEAAFHGNFGATLPEVWEDFVESMRAEEPGDLGRRGRPRQEAADLRQRFRPVS